MNYLELVRSWWARWTFTQSLFNQRKTLEHLLQLEEPHYKFSFECPYRKTFPISMKLKTHIGTFHTAGETWEMCHMQSNNNLQHFLQYFQSECIENHIIVVANYALPCFVLNCKLPVLFMTIIAGGRPRITMWQLWSRLTTSFGRSMCSMYVPSFYDPFEHCICTSVPFFLRSFGVLYQCTLLLRPVWALYQCTPRLRPIWA